MRTALKMLAQNQGVPVVGPSHLLLTDGTGLLLTTGMYLFLATG